MLGTMSNKYDVVRYIAENNGKKYVANTKVRRINLQYLPTFPSRKPLKIGYNFRRRCLYIKEK
jgi:hypothetical protein